jgi:stress response protein SCP2
LWYSANETTPVGSEAEPQKSAFFGFGGHIHTSSRTRQENTDCTEVFFVKEGERKTNDPKDVVFVKLKPNSIIDDTYDNDDDDGDGKDHYHEQVRTVL